MAVLVVGSVAFDSLETPFGTRPKALGGSATYFSTAASLLTDVRLVAVVGDDFPQEHIDMLKERDVDTSGLEVVEGGKTFFWKGRYGANLNEAETLDTQLNVFASFEPKLPEHFKSSEYVFLANIHPAIQARVLDQVDSPKLIALDTMNFWIEGERDALLKVLPRVDVLTLNDGEARLLAGDHNVVRAAKAIASMGPKSLIIKRGEYGALYVKDQEIFWAPAFPLESVFDPTGAGDSFAGGFMGYLSRVSGSEPAQMRKAIIMGCVMASFTVEDFSVDRLKQVTHQDLKGRFAHFRRLVHFEDLSAEVLAPTS